MTRDTLHFPERKLDLITGYIEAILLISGSVIGVLMLLH
jgi:hypothetical protein